MCLIASKTGAFEAAAKQIESRVSGAALALFLGALRIVNSPFGRVLQAIATTMLRGSARLPHRHLSHRRHLPGGRHGDPTLSFTIMIDILLMTVIGGMGTIYGAAVAATLFLLSQNYLQKLMASAAQTTAQFPLISPWSPLTAGCCGSGCPF